MPGAGLRPISGMTDERPGRLDSPSPFCRNRGRKNSSREALRAMSDNAIFPVPAALARDAWIDEAKYDAMYAASMADPAKFWGEQGKRLHWIKPYTKVKDVSYKGDVHIRWYYDGTLNVAANCLDRHLATSADEGLRGGKKIPLKRNVDEALQRCPSVKTCLVIRRTGGDIPWVAGRDVWYHEAMTEVSDVCPPEAMGAEDPLFILYTSGSTGKPKGVLHTTGGYLVYAAYTHQNVFDYHDGDIYWCTADVGWVTGHSYIVYGPLANGATTLMFEGVPNYPDSSRFWQVIDKHKVNIFYTAPTAIRALMREGEEPVKRTSRKSLRLLGSAGEPINPEDWLWHQ